jgi:hypothetical protein
MFGMTPFFETIRSLIPRVRFNPMRALGSILAHHKSKHWHQRPTLWLCLSVILIGIMSAAGTAQAFSISGTVTNNTSTAGRVYLSLDLQGGGHTSLEEV